MTIRHQQQIWSGAVVEHSTALDLAAGLFTESDRRRIARSLKSPVVYRHRRKASPFRFAMSMLTFCINRAGKAFSRVRWQWLAGGRKAGRRRPATERGHFTGDFY